MMDDSTDGNGKAPDGNDNAGATATASPEERLLTAEAEAADFKDKALRGMVGVAEDGRGPAYDEPSKNEPLKGEDRVDTSAEPAGPGQWLIGFPSGVFGDGSRSRATARRGAGLRLRKSPADRCMPPRRD